MNTIKYIFFLICLGLSFGFTQNSCAAADYPPNGKDYWSLLGGYGCSAPGWGATTERVKTFDGYLRYNHILNRNIGEDWHRFNQELWIELPVIVVVEPGLELMTGMNFICGLVFNAVPSVNPYVFIGGGPFYTTAAIPGMGSKLCGNYLAGAGVRWLSDEKSYTNLEVRYHHVSNMGLVYPNVPINSAKIMGGVSYYF